MSNSPVPPNPPAADDKIIGVALVISLIVLVVLAMLIGGGVMAWLWFSAAPAPAPVAVSAPPTVRTEVATPLPKIPFTDITESAGIGFVHENGYAGEKLLPETMGGGCAFFDYDNDGDADLLFVNSTYWPWDKEKEKESTSPPTMALYANNGNGQFENVTESAGLDVSFYGMGVACGDIDNDGWTDLYFSAVGPGRLFRNNEGKFVEVTESAGFPGDSGDPNQWSSSCGFFDYDNDGDLDLFVCHYLIWSRDDDVSKNFQLVGVGRGYGRPQDFPGTVPKLYENDGAGRFTDVSNKSGVEMFHPATGVPVAKSLGLTFCDFDGDGWMDIFVANDTVQNMLFHNQSDGTFEEVAIVSGVAFDTQGRARGAMGIHTAHFRNDDSIGIAIGNFSNEMSALYVSLGRQLQFTDDAIPTGLGPNTRLDLTFGMFFFDADLDGRLDLFSANGHLEEDINKVLESQTYEQPPRLFWNVGPDAATEFVPLTAKETGEDLLRPMVGRGATFADIDGDGDLDILITASGDKPRLLRNDQTTRHHWLRVKLTGNGASTNRDAIGSWVEVVLGDETMRQQIMPTGSYLSQFERTVTFGLGDAKQIDRVVIRWADGSEQAIENPAVDQLLEIEQEGNETQ